VKLKKLWIVLIFILVGVSGCQSPQTSQPTPTAAQPTALPSATPEPSPTPLPGRLAAFGSLDEATRSFLETQAGQAGLVFSSEAAFSADLIPAEAEVVVVAGAVDGLAQAAAERPQVQFIAVSPLPLEASANLAVIRSDPLQEAFAAGFLSIMLTPDWRSAGIFSAVDSAPVDAFQNGGRYFCGDCAPGWPLGERYPKVGTPGDVQNLINTMKAEVFYLSAEAITPELVASLAGKTQLQRAIIVFGNTSAPPELQPQWAASLTLDLQTALGSALSEAFAGRSAGALSADITLTQVNPDLLSPGKQERWLQMLADLRSGKIVPNSVAP